jgi:formiminotetrahydrofolate cyclodeaminase
MFVLLCEAVRASFLEELARAQPNPGGGAAAAYGATLALALLMKVVKLELKRPKNAETTRLFWEKRLAEMRRLQEELAHLREADVRAYMNLARALRQEDHDLASALEEAIDCPQRIMASAVRGLREVAEAGERCQKHLISDLHVACEFLGAAIYGAYHIAAANLPLIVSLELRQNHAGKLDGLVNQGSMTLREVRQALAARTSSPGGA